MALAGPLFLFIYPNFKTHKPSGKTPPVRPENRKENHYGKFANLTIGDRNNFSCPRLAVKRWLIYQLIPRWVAADRYNRRAANGSGSVPIYLRAAIKDVFLFDKKTEERL